LRLVAITFQYTQLHCSIISRETAGFITDNKEGKPKTKLRKQKAKPKKKWANQKKNQPRQ
jgi:hypothetical protein